MAADLRGRPARTSADEPDLAPAHERWLGEWAERASTAASCCSSPVTRWHSKPFYTYPDPERPGYSYGFDLLFRGSEIVTGGQRLHRHEDYLKALAARGDRPARRTPATCRCSSTVCRRTAGSRSGWSAGPRG